VNREDGALAEFAVDVDRAAVVADDVFDNGEAEAGSPQLARAGRIDAVEPLGQAGE
jgi:hypothetical protein